MCDGGYDSGGYGDPDYYDLEFRQQNPDVYGNDEYMQDYYGDGRRVQNTQRSRYGKRDYRMSEADKQFHEEYLQWKRKHPERVRFFQNPSDLSYSSPSDSQQSVWPNIIVALIVYPLVIFLLVQSCGD